MNAIPINTPEKYIYKYNYIYSKEYDLILKEIYSVGLYCTYRQFYSLYKKLNPELSDNYIKKKCTKIIKELASLGFIEINNINRNKYFYLKKAAQAIFTGNYNNVPRFNHMQNMKNNKFLVSLMKVEYYITNNSIINNSNLNYHLKSLTSKIHAATLKYKNLNYNINDLEYILNETEYSKIKERLNSYKSDNILRIIWYDIYNIYRKLLLQNQTVTLHPKFFNLYIVKNTLRLHYVPEILIFDFHDIKYYENQINNLFHDFFNITANTTNNMQNIYKESNTLGSKQNNRIGYTLTLVGYNKAALMKKTLHINNFINENKNIHSPLIDSVKYIYIDIAKYIDHSSQYNSTLANADNYVDTQMKALLNLK